MRPRLQTRACVSDVQENEEKREDAPEDVGFLAIPPAENFGSNVLAISLPLEVLRKVAVALRAHPPFASLGPPNRLARVRLPPRTRHRRSSHDAQRVRPRPARRESKVANLEVPSIGDEDVGGLEVEVDDVPPVEVRDASGDFGQDLPDARLVEDFVQATVLLEEDGEVPVLTELGLDEEVTRLLPGVDEGDEVGGSVDVGREEAEDIDFFESTKAAQNKQHQQRNLVEEPHDDSPILGTRKRMLGPLDSVNSSPLPIRHLERVAKRAVPERAQDSVVRLEPTRLLKLLLTNGEEDRS